MATESPWLLFVLGFNEVLCTLGEKGCTVSVPKGKRASPLLWFTGLDTGLLHSQGTSGTVKSAKPLTKSIFYDIVQRIN